jgi:hypothetical protein
VLQPNIPEIFEFYLSLSKQMLGNALKHATTMVETIFFFIFVDGKPEMKWPLERHGRRWEDNIKIDLKK